MRDININHKHLSRLLLLTGLCCYLYYLMEWSFFLSRPSMLSYLSLTDSLLLLFTAPFPLLLLSLSSVCLITFLAFFIPKKSIIIDRVAYVVPALILTCMAFLMLDNFTYTVFGIASHSATTLMSQGYYWIMITLLFIYFTNKMSMVIESKGTLCEHLKPFYILFITLILLSILSLWMTYSQPLNTKLELDVSAKKTDFPNIIFFSADGVNSKNMSVYGYKRDTTPFLNSISHESVIYQNHWTNSAKTTGSVGALLSGKYPTRTKVIFRPDTFKGQDMFQHLPGILKNQGYYNFDISLRHYIDPADLKMRNAFDYANHRLLANQLFTANNLFLLRWPVATQFLEENWQRLYQRLAHLIDYKSMVNPHRLVNQGAEVPAIFSDIDRMKQLKEQIKIAPRPYFANVHLLGPHGKKFDYEKAIFTQTKAQPEHWMPDHYDNAIFQWDAYSKEIYQLVQEQGELDNTLLVFSSDHGKRHVINETLPLIIRYPKKEYTGSVILPSQRMDIAPTVLSYLGVKPPQWMDGHSLLSRGKEAYPIFIVSSSKQQAINAGDWKVAANLTYPFYSLGSISMAYCGTLYSIDINNINALSFEHQKVHARDSVCPLEDLTPKLAYEMILDHLASMGYDTDKLNY
ncbi:sulfatase-like hydrolase/transferase [Shewanella sp. 4_MG-2023]|uniref:sulfatase-like hydrolase/transferase n=1 Tax=Shewanella sp. 4_MG-2023 TaxID=3062652 RepID=UPI0026E33EE9|nr:sulfatase-like hydrolase/transferase [Shewanella sp. 4_MG-2023]MDO6677545.1 sulfatase-like hydrolase/transferase [Shewanella sp. 4_MG-2023]